MTRIFVRHDVEDFATWKKGYDEEAQWQREGGVTDEAVFQSVDDPNDVTVIHEFNTLDEARAFASNPELKAKMDALGVTGSPQIWFAERA